MPDRRELHKSDEVYDGFIRALRTTTSQETGKPLNHGSCIPLSIILSGFLPVQQLDVDLLRRLHNEFWYGITHKFAPEQIPWANYATRNLTNHKIGLREKPDFCETPEELVQLFQGIDESSLLTVSVLLSAEDRHPIETHRLALVHYEPEGELFTLSGDLHYYPDKQSFKNLNFINLNPQSTRAQVGIKQLHSEIMRCYDFQKEQVGNLDWIKPIKVCSKV